MGLWTFRRPTTILLLGFVTLSALAVFAKGEDSTIPVITDNHGANPDYLFSPKSDPVSSSNHSSHSHNDSHTDEHSNDTDHGSGGHGHGELHVAAFAYDEVRDPLIFTIVVLLAGISKIGYHHADFLSSKVPESCILIILGLIFGAIIHFSGIADNLPQFFKPHEFFIFLLPPIILEAAFSLHDRTFMENIGTVLLFAVVGTVLAHLMIGATLFGLAKAGAMGDIQDLTFVQVMLFSSLIVAVDPVAVLAVFNEIGVNHVLYFLVFGESLLNDGVTVVLYKVYQAYNIMDEIEGIHLFLGVVKFFVVCIGGLVIGVAAGFATALLTKYSTHVKVAQPIIIFTMAYFGFLLAELFEFSGIISIIGCGLTQVQYAFHNISDKSRTTIKYFTKVISSTNEIVIFLFLGLSAVTNEHEWHTGFTLWTLLLCLVYRFMITFALAGLINSLDIYRVRKIGFHEQFMIAYGGLRGAVCFSLVALLETDALPAKNMFVTSTLAVIMFTVFIQGISIKPLVFWLQISLAPEKCPTMYKELIEHVNDHLMAGVEDIIGDHGRNHLREKFEVFDQKYLRPHLLVDPDPSDASLRVFYENLLLKEHYKYLKLSGAKTPEGITDLDTDMTSVIHMLGSLNVPALDLWHHVNTETLLNSLVRSQDDIVPTPVHVERRPTIVIDNTPESPTSPVAGSMGNDKDVTLRKRGRNSRSMSLSPLASGTIDAMGFRHLLQSNRRNSRMVLSKYDRNLTELDENTVEAEIRKRSHRNHDLQRLFAPSDADGVRRRSWSEQDSKICAERTSERKKAPPRHAMTVDYGMSGRMGVVEPLNGNSTPLIEPLTPMSPYLDSVFEEEEPPLATVEEENEKEPMLEKEVEGPKMKRGGIKSSKHRLERQMGLDKQQSPSAGQEDLPMLAGEEGLEDIPLMDVAGEATGDAGETKGDDSVTVEIKDRQSDTRKRPKLHTQETL